MKHILAAQKLLECGDTEGNGRVAFYDADDTRLIRLARLN